MDDVSEMYRLAIAQLKFIPLSERTIEHPHGQIQLKIRKKRCLPAFVSKSVRHPQMLRLVDCDAAAFELLVSCFEAVRDDTELAKEMRLSQHPLWVRLHKRLHRHQRRRLLSHALSQADLDSMFRTMKEPRKRHLKATAKGLLVAGRAARRAHQAISLEELIADVAFEHFRSCAQCDHADAFFSFRVHQVRLLDVQVAMSSLRDADIVQDALEGQQVFIRILHAFPSRLKTSKVPVAAGGRLDKGDMAVSVHTNIGTEAIPVLVHDPLLVRTCILRGLQQARTILNVQVWKYDPVSVMYAIRNFTSRWGLACMPLCLDWSFARGRLPWHRLVWLCKKQEISPRPSLQTRMDPKFVVIVLDSLPPF